MFGCERYVFVEKLGKGSFGEVNRYRDEYGRDIAIKKIPLKRYPNELVEVRILEMIKGAHPAFLEIKKSGIQGKNLLIYTEMIHGKDLYDVISGKDILSYSQIKSIFSQLLEAMQIAHEMSIVHRDIKPENIMISDEEDGSFSVKILDWGLARMVGQESTGGSVFYAPPESITGKCKASQTNDIWSLGAVLYCMLTRRMVFPGQNNDSIIRKIINIEVNYNAEGLSPIDVKFLRKIFVLQKLRPSCRDLLNDEWFSKE